MSFEPAIELRNLTKDYATTRALNDVCLTVNRGEIFGYVGANGAGKTTTIKILAGLIRPSYGDALVSGHSILSHPLEVKAQVGYVPESGAIFEKLSPREYLTAVANLYKLEASNAQKQIEEWLAFFDLSDRIDQRMEVFSKGTKQKVCWTAALLHDPKVLILDEPLSGLDVETISRVKDLMKRFVADGKTIFYSSHLIDVVEKVCTRIAVLHRGRMIGVGSVDEVRLQSGAPSLEEALMKLWQDQT
jgi:ABC-2 type transport system ATP-binding protein